jgi:hypothetical protein
MSSPSTTVSPRSARRGERAAVLILALWVLFLLGLLAVAVGTQAAAQLEFARRLRGRTAAYYVAKAGVEQAKAILATDSNAWDSLNERWASSVPDFSSVRCGDGLFTVWHVEEGVGGLMVTNYGVSDEQGRVDLNRSERVVLSALFREVGGLGEGDAEALAQRVEEFRGPAESPRPLRVAEDLLAVEGVTVALWHAVAPYVTVFGDRRLNLNTASGIALRTVALAADAGSDGATRDGLARRIARFRTEGHAFTNRSGYEVVAALESWEPLPAEEQALLTRMLPLLGVNGRHFSGTATGALAADPEARREIRFVWDRETCRIRSWHED